MNKIYQYRKFIQWGQYVIPVVFSILTAFWIYMSVTIARFSSPLVFVMLCVSSIFAIEGVTLWYLYYRLAGVRVIFEENAIVYKHRTGETKIYFIDITQIGLPSIPYIGGWITIIAGKEKIRLTVVIKEIGDFVQTLKASVDKIGLANQYDEAKLFRFLKTAVFADQSWERIEVIFWKYILGTIITGFIGIGIATISHSAGFFWILFSFLYPSLVYGVTEIVFARHIAKSAVRERFSAPTRDIAYENSVYKVAIIIGSVIYFILALVMIFI